MQDTLHELYTFVRALLFGHRDYRFTPCNSLLINELVAELSTLLPVQDTIRGGGLLTTEIRILHDLEQVVQFLQQANEAFLNRGPAPPAEMVLKSAIVRQFVDRLRQACRGNLAQGVFATGVLPHTDLKPTPSDEETLEHLLNRDSDWYLSFHSAEYWGKLAQTLLHHQQPYRVSEPLQAPVPELRAIQRVYDLTCQARGGYLDPYALRLVPHHPFVDPLHWQSVKALTFFIQHYPEHGFSKTCTQWVQGILTALLSAREDGIPPRVLKHEGCLRTLIQNVERIHRRLPQVPGHHTPFKLMDVLHRLLALLKYDYMWDEVQWDAEGDTAPDPFPLLKELYLKNVALERENQGLRHQLAQVPTPKGGARARCQV